MKSNDNNGNKSKIVLQTKMKVQREQNSFQFVSTNRYVHKRYSQISIMKKDPVGSN